MIVRLYLDEDSSDIDLLKALRLRGVDAVGTQESGMRGRSDQEQLRWADNQGRVLYTLNRRDFYALHSELMKSGAHHSGIILGEQQRYSVGEQLHRLLRLMSKVTAQEMQNRLEFLSAWSE